MADSSPRATRPRYAPSTTKADWIAYSERLEAACAERDSDASEMAAFIGHKDLGDEYDAWVLARRAEIDRLLEEADRD